ncbi:MFS transporter, partial [Pseudoalteromonas sp.]
MQQSTGFNLLSFNGKMKVLHLSWMVFFVSFFVWFNHAPMLGAIAASLDISMSEVKTLLILNVALTIPARVVIGMLTDKYGPRIVYAALLITCSIPCFMFAAATTFEQAAIARFALGFIGAGFVVGIRMVSEWFPANELGIAEGIYGGWGNFGSAAAAMSLPVIAVLFGGEDGWRYAIAVTGVISILFGIIWFFNVRDTPKGSTYFKPKKVGAMEVTSKGDFVLLLVMKIPMYAALALLSWKLSDSDANLISSNFVLGVYGVLILLYLYEVYKTFDINKAIFKQPVPESER